MASSVEVSWMEEGCRNVDEMVYNLVNHNQLGVDSTFLECGPTKIADHLGSATCGTVVSSDKSSGSSLNRLELVDIGGGVWIPCCAGVFQDGSYKRLVALGLHILWAACKVPPEKGKRVVCLLGCSGNMVVP